MSADSWTPDSGDLRRRVTIKLWTDTANAGFGIDQVFDAGITRWAKIETVFGVTYWGGKQTGEEVTHKIYVRYSTGSKPEDLGGQHVVDYPQGNRRFRIVRATNIDDMQKFTMLECKDLGVIT